MTNPSQSERLRWGCRRGMLELDMLLLPFFDEHYHHMTEKEKLTFEALLEEADQTLWEWLLDLKQPESKDMAALIGKIRAHAKHQGPHRVAK